MKSLRLGYVFILLSSFASSSYGQLSPEKALASLQVADGLQVELFASEPMLVNPTSIDVDHKGRVWVCEAVNYRQRLFGKPPIRKEGDRIVVLEDTNGDGKADQSHTFYQAPEIAAPLGVCVAPYPDGKGMKVFVCQSPQIWVFEDKNGDLKADGPPTVLLKGFQGIDHDHGVHGINIGPDGKLYFTVGDAGLKGLQSSDGKGKTYSTNNTDCRAGTVWRCDMDGKNLELIAHNFRNNYECCVNSFGDIWLSDNDDDGNQQTRICFVMPGGNYGYYPRGPGQSHWHEEQPGIVHKALRTGFGSPTGICFYEGTLLPKKYHGQLLHTDAGPRELRCFHIKPNGASFDVEKENLITSSDNWFRLADVCVAPDGSVMVADWYDPGVGGHGMGDTTRGRIYRLTPKGHKGYKVPEIKIDAKEGVRTALASPCLATRALAIAKLRSMSDVDLLGTIGVTYWDNELRKLFENKAPLPADIPQFLVRSTWMLAERSLKITDRKEKLKEDDAGRGVVLSYVAVYDFFEDLKVSNTESIYIRLLPSFTQKGVIPAVVTARTLDEFLEDITNKKSNLTKYPNLQREIAIILVHVEASKAKSIFNKLAKLYDGKDRFYLSALNIACGTDPKRRDEILADFDKHFPTLDEKTLNLIWELRPTSVLPRLEKELTNAKLAALVRARIIDVIAASNEVSAGQTLIKVLQGSAPKEVKSTIVANLKQFLPTKWASLRKSKELTDAIQKLISQPESASLGLTLVASSDDGTPESVVLVRRIAQDKENALSLRKEAISTLGKLKNESAVDVLATFVQGKSNLRLDAVQAMGSLLPNSRKKGPAGSQKALDLLEKLLLDKDASSDLKGAILSAFAGNRAGTEFVLDLQGKKQFPETLVVDAGRLLRNSPFQDLRNKAMIAFPAGGKLDPKKLPPITELVKRSGNLERGRQLLQATLTNEAQCLKCHTVRGVGGSIGPDLSMIGKKASKENLIESILNPSKAIADQYVQWQVMTDAGVSIDGLLIEETPQHIILRDANGKDTKIGVKEIERKRKLQTSIMPENLVVTLTEESLMDLVEYMMTLKTASLTPDNWNIVGPFPGGTIDTIHGVEKEKAIDLKATFDGKGGKVAWKSVKPNSNGYIDLQSYHGASSPNSISYLYQVIDSPKDQDATLLLGNDDEVRIWLNSKEVFTNRDHFAASPEQHRISVKLKKGPNSVLVKITNGNNPHGLYFTITSEEELKLAK